MPPCIRGPPSVAPDLSGSRALLGSLPIVGRRAIMPRTKFNGTAACQRPGRVLCRRVVSTAARQSEAADGPHNNTRLPAAPDHASGAAAFSLIGFFGMGVKHKKKYQDITGEAIGCLTAVAPAWLDRFGKRFWRFACTCGGERTAVPSELRRQQRLGHAVHCPDCRFGNLVGREFEQLLVLARQGTDASGNRRWRCRCRCGAICMVATCQLTDDTRTACRACEALRGLAGDGQRLRQRRLQLGLSLAAAGVLLGITRQAVQQYEKKQTIRPQRLAEILLLWEKYRKSS